MKIIIDNERYGERSTFSSLVEAVAAIRACGADFSATEFEIRGDGQILDECGVIVGEQQ